MKNTFNVLRTIFAVVVLLAFGGTANAQIVIWGEDFNTTTYGNIPAGWTLGDGGSWVHTGFPTSPDTTWCVTNSTDGQGNDAGNDLGDAAYLFIDSDNAGSGISQQDTITSPVIDLSGQTNVALSFKTHFRSGFGTTGDLEVYDATSGTWVNLKNYSTATVGGWGTAAATETFDISMYASSQFQFRFVFSGNWSWYWAIDQVQITKPATDDIKMISVALKNALQACSGEDSVVIQLTNLGGNPASNIPVSYVVYTNGAPGTPVTATIAGPVNPGDTVVYTFAQSVTLNAVGVAYQIQAYSALPGDVVPSNDTAMSAIYLGPASLPIQVDFTGYTGFNLSTVFPGWYEANGVWGSTPVMGNSGWTRDDWLNNAGSVNGDAAKVNLYTNTKTGEWIISPKFVVPSNGKLTYDIGTTDWGSTSLTDSLGSDDTVHVAISTDCGITWTALKTYTRANTPPVTGINEIIDLSSYAGQTVRIAFYATEGTVDDPDDIDLFLDNINIYQPPANDLGVTVVSLQKGIDCSGTDSVTVTIKNFGSAAQSNFPVTYVLYTNGTAGTPVTDTVSATLNSLTTMSYTFSTPVSVSANGDYYVVAYTGLAGDADNANDTATSMTYPYYKFAPSNTSPWVETFETFGIGTSTSAFDDTLKNGWTTSPLGGYHWNVRTGGTPSGSTGPSAAYEGTKYMYTEASSGSPGDEAYLVSPCIDLSGVTNPHLTFAYHFFGASIDRMYIDVTTNGGTTWMTLDSIVGPQQTANADPWKLDTVSLASYAGQTIKFRFRGIRGSSFTGDMAIDSVAVWNKVATGVDIMGVDLSAPSSVCVNSSFNVSAIFTNNGTTASDTVFYTLSVNNAKDTTFTIAAGANDTVTFNNVSFSTAGTYTIKVYATSNGDVDNANDTLTQTITVNNPPTFTLSGPTSGVVDSIYCFNTGSITADSIVWTIPANGTVTSSSGDTLRCIKFSSAGTYNVIATVYSGGCMAKDTVTIQITPVGITFGLANQVKVFPNPVNDVLNISLVGNANAAIYDLRGNKLYEGTIVNETSIDMSQFAKGVYLLRLNANGEIVNIKVIKQ